MIVFDLNFAKRNPSVRNMLSIFELTGNIGQICSSTGEIAVLLSKDVNWSTKDHSMLDPIFHFIKPDQRLFGPERWS